MNRKVRPTTHHHRITISDWLNEATVQLKRAGVESARLDALLLLENVLKKPREWILSHGEDTLNESQLVILNKNLLQRKSHQPLAYIVGSKEFYGRDFLVTPDVLIPRPESEIMIELLEKLANSKQQIDINTVIDIGTGSGCLAITAKLLFPQFHVNAIDSSTPTLKVARKNALRHNAQVLFKKQDINDGLPQMPKTRPYVLLVNLPYVPDSLITSEEITHEPAIALFSGSDGLNHYQVFWQQVSNLTNKPLYIFTESLKDQHKPLQKLAAAAGFTLVKTKDLIQQFESL